MKCLVSMTVIVCFCCIAGAEDAELFTAPRGYPVGRYEAGWSKNPFTLKTAPVVENAQFAKDLAIGAYYGDTANPTIVIVNTKTNERIRLKKGQPAPNGMKLDKVQFGSGRKDLVVDVTLGSETSEIRYNDGYVKQMASAETVGQPSAVQRQVRQSQMVPQQPGAPVRTPMPQLPVQPGAGGTVSPGGAGPARVGASPASVGFTGNISSPALLAQAAATRVGAVGSPITQPTVDINMSPAQANDINPTVSIGSQTGPAAVVPVPVSSFPQTNDPAAIPVPVRRRFASPMANASTTAP